MFTAIALQQLDSLYLYISNMTGEARAENYVGRIVKSCERLETFPMRGSARDDLLTGLRMIGFERRVTVAFVVETDVVNIAGVFYGGQQFEAAFDERE